LWHSDSSADIRVIETQSRSMCAIRIDNDSLRSQAAQQGLAMLIASHVVVVTHETSTFRRSHNFISIDFKFGVDDYVREVTSPAKG